MRKIQDVVHYLIKTYPHKQELSKARLTKMVYLADWLSAIRAENQITSIEWIFHNHGPYVDDVVNSVRTDDHLRVVETTNAYGNKKELIVVAKEFPLPELSPDEKQILDHVVQTCAPLYWNEFMRLVYSTYPVMTQPRYTVLELPQRASEYKTLKDETEA